MPPRKSNQNKKKSGGGGKRNATDATKDASPSGIQAMQQVVLDSDNIVQEQEKTRKPKIAAAFSLGTEHSTVTLLPKEGGQSGQIIANEDGERHIPCIVSLVGEELIAGTAGKAQMIRNMEGSVRFFVPLIGLKFNDKKVQSVIRSLPVPVEEDENGFPVFVLTQTIHASTEDDSEWVEDKRRCNVPELVIVLLRSLKQSAESFTGAEVDQCYLSYSLDFQLHQIDELRICAEKAGMQVISMIAEPLAAVLAFQQIHLTSEGSASNTDGLWMVVDTGAFFTTLTLVNVVSGLYTIVGNVSFLGGGLELDQALSEHFTKDFEKKHAGCVVTQKKAFQKMAMACETTRKVLSSHTSSNCHVEAFHEGMDYAGVLNRLRFESLARPWRANWESKIGQFLEDINIDPFEIDRVLCVGGVLKTPRFLQVLESCFGNATLDTSVESDLAISYGTALHSLQRGQHSLTSSINTPTPHLRYPLGVLNQKDEFITLLPKFSALPLHFHIILEQPALPTSVCLKLAEGRELLPPTQLSPEDEEDHGEPASNGHHADEEPRDGPEPIYLGTLLSECQFKLDAGINIIDLNIHINTESEVHVTGAAIHKESGQKELLAITL